MITGWKSIVHETGFSRNSIKRLAREEDFPLQYILSRPVLSRSGLASWLDQRHKKTLQKKHPVK